MKLGIIKTWKLQDTVSQPNKIIYDRVLLAQYLWQGVKGLSTHPYYFPSKVTPPPLDYTYSNLEQYRKQRHCMLEEENHPRENQLLLTHRHPL